MRCKHFFSPQTRTTHSCFMFFGQIYNLTTYLEGISNITCTSHAALMNDCTKSSLEKVEESNLARRMNRLMDDGYFTLLFTVKKLTYMLCIMMHLALLMISHKVDHAVLRRLNYIWLTCIKGWKDFARSSAFQKVS